MACRSHHRGYVVLDERAQEIRSVTSWSPQPCNLPAARSMHLAWASTVGRGGRASAHRDSSGAVWGEGLQKRLDQFWCCPVQEVALSKLTYASEVVAHLPGPSAQDDSYRSLPVDATIGGIVTDDPRGGFILLPLSLTYDEMEGACREQCAAARSTT